MYVVIATHDTSHGEVSTPILLTEDLERAVDIAKSVRKGVPFFGYTFYGNGTGCSVYALKLNSGVVQAKTHPSSLVFCRIIYGKRWKEEWVDLACKRTYLEVRYYRSISSR